MAIDSALVGEVVSQSALRAFDEALTPMVGAFATDFSSDAMMGVQTINIPIFNSYTAGTFAGDYTTGASNDVGATTVTIDKHAYKTISLTDLERANNGASATRAEDFGQKLGEALALYVYQDVLSLVTAANFGAAAFTGTSTGFDSDDVVDIKNIVDVADMPKVGRNLLLSDEYYNAVLKNSANVKNASEYGSAEGVRAGMIPNLAGFSVWQTGAIPANGENLVGFACVQDAICLGMRYLQPAEGHMYSVAEPVAAPQTGVTLGRREWYDRAKGTKYMTLEANYGYATGVTAGLKRIVSA